MSNEWINGMLDPKISKEADLVGKDAKETFEKKVVAHDWIKGVSELDPEVIEKEYQEKLAEEARMLGKTAAYEMGETPKETIEKDYARDVKILSDYALAEMLAEARGHEAQNTNEMYYELKEKAKSEVASSREKAEKALLELIPDHTMLDWQKAFEKFTKEAKPEEPKEKDLFKSEVPEKAHDFEHPTEEKFKVPAEDKKADVMIGVGREADDRKEVTQQAGVLKADITEGLSKVAEKVKDSPANDKENIAMPEGEKSAGDKPVEAVEEPTAGVGKKEVGDKDDQAAEANSPEKGDKAKHDEAVNKEAHCGMDHSKTADEAVQPIKREQLYDQAASACPVCGGTGEDLGNLGQLDHMRCRDCGITYSHGKEAKCATCASLKTEAATPPYPVEDVEPRIPAGEETTASDIAETFINGNISDAREWVGGDLSKFMEVMDILGFGSPEGQSFQRIMRKGSQEIKSQVSKEDVIKKVAEISSPWVVQKLEDGTEVIARVEQPKNEKVSEEAKDEEIQK
jgi:hypothetical protein